MVNGEYFGIRHSTFNIHHSSFKIIKIMEVHNAHTAFVFVYHFFPF